MLIHARWRWWLKKVAVRIVRDAFFAAVDADELIDLIIPRRNVVVADGPIETESISRFRLEINLRHAQRNAAPVVGAATEHARAPPHEVLVGGYAVVDDGILPAFVGLALHGVWFAGHIPAADGGIVKSIRLFRKACSAQRSIRECLKHRRFLDGIVVATSLEHQNFGAFFGENPGGHAASGAAADDDGVIGFGTSA